MGMGLSSSLVAVSTCLLLTSPAQAAPTNGELAPPGLRLRLTRPRLLAQSPGEPATGQPAAGQPAAGQPAPYYPAQTPGAYPPPAQGAYPATPGDAPYPYPAAPYPMPYYYAPLAPPPDMRPTYMEYDPNKPIPAGYRLEKRIRKGLVIPGSITFGISYGIAILVGTATEDSDTYEYSSSSSSNSNGVPYNSKLLFIPVLGPWIALATSHDYARCSSSSYSSSSCWDDARFDLTMWRIMLTVGGVTQGLGALLFTMGIAMPSRQLVLTENVRAQIVPVPMGNSGQGLAMVGSFGGL